MKKLRESLSTRQVAEATRGLSELSEQLGYHLRPPYTDVMELKAREENERFAIKFRAELSMHYARDHNDGLLFTLQFKGETYADSPNPPIHELFYAGHVDSFVIRGYGARWKGEPATISQTLAENLELPSQEVVTIELADLESQLDKA
jgi:hypothetical protein